MADSTKGGRIRMEIDGVSFTTRAKAKIMPARISIKNGANQNGSMFTSVDSTLATLDATFDRGAGLVWDETMMLKTMNVTFTETDISPNKVHQFTNARWDGTPEINTEDGEVTGLKIVTDQYLQA